MRRWVPFLVAVFFVGAIAWAQSTVKADQGRPGNQGPWSVQVAFDGGFTGTTAPYACNIASPNKVTNVLAASLATPSSAQAGRKWISVCNSVQNAASRVVKCRADGTAPVFAAGNPGDVLGVGDCVTYTIPSTQNVLCISNSGAGTDVQTYECF
jgi:hypothetical protein